jgi:hypothetical protein
MMQKPISDKIETISGNLQESKLFLRAEPRGVMQQWIHEISLFSSTMIPSSGTKIKEEEIGKNEPNEFEISPTSVPPIY